MRDLHLIYTKYDGFYAIESPQIPELVGGRTTPAELEADLPEMLELAKVALADFDNVYDHEQHIYFSPEGVEYVVRVYLDDDAIRDRSAGRVIAGIEEGYERDNESKQPQLQTGERLIIAATGSDRIGWFMDQLREGEGAIVEWNKVDDVCYSLPLLPDDLSTEDSSSLASLGLTADSTVSECFDRVIAAEVSNLAGDHVSRALLTR